MNSTLLVADPSEYFESDKERSFPWDHSPPSALNAFDLVFDDDFIGASSLSSTRRRLADARSEIACEVPMLCV